MTGAGREDLLIVLLDALERYYRHLSAVDAAGLAAFDEIVRWFVSTENVDPRAFESICAQRGIDPRRIRESLVRRRSAAWGHPAHDLPPKH